MPRIPCATLRTVNSESRTNATPCSPASRVARCVVARPAPEAVTRKTPAMMKAEVQRDQAEVAARYDDRPRHTIQVDYWPYLDHLTSLVEANETRLSSRS